MSEPPGVQTREAPDEAPGAIVPAKTHLSSSAVVPQAATDVKDKDKIQHTNTQIHMRVIACHSAGKDSLLMLEASSYRSGRIQLHIYKDKHTRTQIQEHIYKDTYLR